MNILEEEKLYNMQSKIIEKKYRYQIVGLIVTKAHYYCAGKTWGNGLPVCYYYYLFIIIS